MFSLKYKRHSQNLLLIFFHGIVKPNVNVYKCLQKSTFRECRHSLNMKTPQQRMVVIKVIKDSVKNRQNHSFGICSAPWKGVWCMPGEPHCEHGGYYYNV